eukprot:TRINITY_DN74469_c0_g1_i1.p1 TRINITY_DN74469_c0_g1~~TRINITY_DN74469_c0_g1_i1.p1  ORF type:complete len:556 (-),score=78.80 TRINITY_DN74469_c0_g1_i1:71-1717(-)
MALLRLLLLLHSLHSSHAAGRIVDLVDGAVEGRAAGAVGVWLGIPYASPPTGDLRWRPPQPPKQWRPEILKATDFRSSCYQQPGDGMGYPQSLSSMSEDCLYLNVYAPLQLPPEPLPVMLWIHGGGFQGGGGNETRLNGTWDVALTDGKLVIVTINYRLGVFGFAASSQLRGRDPDEGTGNYGILDQRFAMKWVQSNIASFGGDRKRVFIVGQSAGAKSVSEHLVRPKSWGLFHAAGLESGAFYDAWPSQRGWTVQTMERSFEVLLQKTNCSQVECLVHFPAPALLHASLTLGSSFVGLWTPVVDGVDLVEDSATLAEKGQLAKVPVLLGSTMEDGRFDTPPIQCGPRSCTEADFRHWLLQVGMDAEQATRGTAIYANEVPRPGSNKWHTAAIHAGADSWGTCPARRAARWVRSVGQRAYLYYWTYIPKGSNGRGLAHHSVEQPFVFHVLSETAAELAGDQGVYHIDQSEVAFSAAIVRYWTSFAAKTAPDGDVPWHPSADDDRWVLLLGDEMNISAVVHPRAKHCDLWDEHYSNQTHADDTATRMVI